MLAWIAETVVVTALAAALVALLCRPLRRRPGLCHGLWWIVLIRFFTPAVPFHWQQLLPRWVEARSAALPARWLAVAEEPVGAPTGMALPHPVLLVLALLWVLGSLLLAVRFWRRSREIHRCVRLSEPAGAALRRRVAAAARRLGVRAPRVRRLEGIASPFLWGTRRPVLLWPATHWTEAEVDSVLLHELAHLRRGDPWTSWAELLVRVLWWWNPVAWWVLRQVQEFKELSCDGYVLATLPGARRQYARILLSTAVEEPFCGAGSVALRGARSSRAGLRRRLRSLYGEPRLEPGGKALLLWAVLLFLGTLPGWLRPPPPSSGPPAVAADSSAVPPVREASAEELRVLERFGVASLAAVERVCRERVEANPQDGEAFHFLGWTLASGGRFDEAAQAFERQDELRYSPSFARYNLACCAAQLGDDDRALYWLGQAADSGLGSWETVRDDPDLESLHDHAEFAALLERFRRNGP